MMTRRSGSRNDAQPAGRNRRRSMASQVDPLTRVGHLRHLGQARRRRRVTHRLALVKRRRDRRRGAALHLRRGRVERRRGEDASACACARPRATGWPERAPWLSEPPRRWPSRWTADLASLTWPGSSADSGRSERHRLHRRSGTQRGFRGSPGLESRMHVALARRGPHRLWSARPKRHPRPAVGPHPVRVVACDRLSSLHDGGIGRMRNVAACLHLRQLLCQVVGVHHGIAGLTSRLRGRGVASVAVRRRRGARIGRLAFERLLGERKVSSALLCSQRLLQRLGVVDERAKRLVIRRVRVRFLGVDLDGGHGCIAGGHHRHTAPRVRPTALPRRSRPLNRPRSTPRPLLLRRRTRRPRCRLGHHRPVAARAGALSAAAARSAAKASAPTAAVARTVVVRVAVVRASAASSPPPPPTPALAALYPTNR